MKRSYSYFENNRPDAIGSLEQAPTASSSSFHRKQKGKQTASKAQAHSHVPQVSVNQSLDTFDLQARDLISRCLMSERRKRDVHTVITDLRNIWKTLMPDFHPIVFGSVANGLAMETSDIDCFVDSKDIPDGNERIKFLMKNWKVMFKGGRFYNMRRIAHARIPILKAVHSRTGIELDISCTSDGALHNTPLINYLVHHDIRVRDLIILVSLFYRLHDLVGTNRFVSYSVTWLVIFYLQNLENPIIPPLCRLLYFQADDKWPQKTADGHDLYSELAKRNTSTLAELSCGYFRFYSSFDFSTVVASPFLGYGIPSADFESPASLPTEFNTLRTALESGKVKNAFDKRLVCVQDPIEHHVNTTSGVGSKVFNKFVHVNATFIRHMNGSPYEGSWLVELMSLCSPWEKNTAASKSFQIEYAPLKAAKNRPEAIACLRRDLISAFELLLMTHSEQATEPEAKMANLQGPFDSHALMVFEVESLYNVFSKRFRNLFEQARSDPQSVKMVTEEHVRISQHMKRPSVAAFRCKVVITPPMASVNVKVNLIDKNENGSNNFLFMSDRLNENFGRILDSVRVANEKAELELPVPSSSALVSVVPSKARKPFTIFIQYSFLPLRKQSDSVDPWGDFKRILTAVFDLLLLAHREVERTPDDTSLVTYTLYSKLNVFKKCFKHEYLNVINNKRSSDSVRQQFLRISQSMKQPETTFHCHCVVTEAPNAVVLSLYDVNDNARNSFSHISAYLRAFLPDLVRAVRDSDACWAGAGMNSG